MARSYKRDKNGRFAGGGGGSGGGKGAGKPRPGQKDRAKTRAQLNMARGVTGGTSKKAAKTATTANKALDTLSKRGRPKKASAGSKPAKAAMGPKTTSARGRAQANERKATKAVKAANKAGKVGRKEAKSMLVAQRAREFYRRSGTGTKRSPSKASAGSKPAKGTVSQRKAAMNKEVSAAALTGKGKRSKQRERYIGSQNRTAAQATAKRGSGNKAARRAAALKR